MTTKRFTIKHYESQDWAYDNGTYIDTRMMVELLNELHEEAITKKEDAEYELLYIKEKYKELFEKNIKQSMGIGQLIDKYEELLEENEQLKKENMEYYHLVNCGNCKYHNYDWFDDGDEFEVCEKGHTERLIYNKFCKEWRKL